MDYYLISTGTGISIYTRPMSNRDQLISSHEEVLNDVTRHFGTENHMSDNQVILLPFACEPNVEKKLLWNQGDYFVYQQLSEREGFSEDLSKQFTPILRVTLRSVEATSNTTWNRSNVQRNVGEVPQARSPFGR